MAIEVKGITWVGTRTGRFAEVVGFYGTVMGLEKVSEQAGVVAFRCKNGDTVEVFDESGETNKHFTTGPVAGFEVADVAAAKAEMERLGTEFIGGSQEGGGFRWAHFRGPDGNVYEITQR